ncbi:XdhC family protein [Streptomyces dengpaensis]|uniref:XdhC family protein n=1 Tax=Streptomyces dengpaensis TaxID=2049881 RepID=A0ABM6SM67_9ACTN|nr:XdhC family protein [Streptomyces dengpaensis]
MRHPLSTAARAQRVQGRTRPASPARRPRPAEQGPVTGVAAPEPAARFALWEALHQAWQTTGSAALATVVSTAGSAPRPAGTPMLITPQ